MATKIGAKRTTPQLALKRKTPLKRYKGLNKMSAKANVELKIWMAVKNARMLALKDKFGQVLCEYCQLPTIQGHALFCAEAHHNDHNRRHNYPSNCRILHRACNQLIEDLNIKNVKSLL